MSLQRRNRRGANAIEFALIAPILFMIMAGVMEYGWFLFNQILLDSAAREGARVGARTEDDSATATLEQEDAAKAAAIAFWDGLGIPGSPTFTPDTIDSVGEDLIVVDANMTYTGLIGFTPAPGQVKARVAVRSEFDD